MSIPKNQMEFERMFSTEEWLEKVWFAKLIEVIDKYKPDIMWFDSWLDFIPESYRQKICAYYLNEAVKLNIRFRVPGLKQKHYEVSKIHILNTARN
jgi:alpha-L-fucosidase